MFKILLYRLLNPIIRKVLPLIFRYEFIIDGLDNVPPGTALFASSHQEFHDIINCIAAIPKHCLFLNTINVSKFIKFVYTPNGAIYVDRTSKKSRSAAKNKMINSLKNGINICMFPEGTWNCTPSKLHLPFFKGVVSVAKEAGVPIVPIVQKFSYDESYLDGKSHIESVHIRFCRPIYCKEEDNELEKLAEYDEIFSTAMWDLIEEKGLYKRNTITNKIYTDYVKARIRDWSIPGNDILDERKFVFGYGDEKYLLYHVNDVDFDENDNLLQTEYIRRKYFDYRM